MRIAAQALFADSLAVGGQMPWLQQAPGYGIVLHLADVEKPDREAVVQHARPFRFGVSGITARSLTEWRDKAQQIEALGYQSLLVWDHFDLGFAPMIALAAAAAATSRLRLGTLVLANDFRHPAVLAKEAASLDVLSDGRLELGLGTGWKQSEYEQAGIPFHSAADRVQRLEESVQVLKRLFQPEPASFAGRHYCITSLRGEPTPVQRPHPPLMIAGARKRMLELAAREADIVALASAVHADGRRDFVESTGGYVAEKVAYVRACAGERARALEFQMHVAVVMITDEREQTAEELAPWFELTVPQLLDCFQVLVGTEDQVVEELLKRREISGVSYITVEEASAEAFAPIAQRLRGM